MSPTRRRLIYVLGQSEGTTPEREGRQGRAARVARLQLFPTVGSITAQLVGAERAEKPGGFPPELTGPLIF